MVGRDQSALGGGGQGSEYTRSRDQSMPGGGGQGSEYAMEWCAAIRVLEVVGRDQSTLELCLHGGPNSSSKPLNLD